MRGCALTVGLGLLGKGHNTQPYKRIGALVKRYYIILWYNGTAKLVIRALSDWVNYVLIWFARDSSCGGNSGIALWIELRVQDRDIWSWTFEFELLTQFPAPTVSKRVSNVGSLPKYSNVYVEKYKIIVMWVHHAARISRLDQEIFRVALSLRN